MKQDPHEDVMTPLVPAFRHAMDILDVATRQSKEWLDADRVRQAYEDVSRLAQTLVSQFDTLVYEQAALRRQLEETQLASQKLKTQFDYREKREAILEQAYVETQLALQSSEMLLKRSEQDKYEIQKHARHLERSHASLVAEHGEVKAKAEQLKIGLATAEEFLAKEVQLGKLTSDELDDVKKAHAITKQDNSRLRMLARNRRHALIEVGNFLASDIAGNRTPKALNDMIEKVAAMARPVDYRTGEALDQTEVYIGVDLAAGPVHTVVVDGMFIDAEPKQPTPDVNMASDTPETGEAAVWYDGQGIPHYDAQPKQEVAEKLGYSMRAHRFPLGGDENNPTAECIDCGKPYNESEDTFCEGAEADDNGVHLAAQITSVAEAIENGQH